LTIHNENQSKEHKTRDKQYPKNTYEYLMRKSL